MLSEDSVLNICYDAHIHKRTCFYLTLMKRSLRAIFRSYRKSFSGEDKDSEQHSVTLRHE